MASKAPLYPIWALVREIRARSGLTQSQLADLSGIPQPKISNYEHARALPDIPTLVSLAERDQQRHSGAHRTFAEAIDANAQAMEAARALRNSPLAQPQAS